MQGKDPKTLIQIARSTGNDETAEPLDLGARVRELRKARDWTLEQAANQAGLARSTLSKIENGQMSPTYEALKKLAVGLEISVPQLFTPPEKGQINGRMAVTQSGAGTAQATTTYEHELLAEHLRQLKSGQTVHVPQYDYAKHNRKSATVEMQPSPLIILEGILVIATIHMA